MNVQCYQTNLIKNKQNVSKMARIPVTTENEASIVEASV